MAVSSTTADTWEGQLAREVADADSSDARASAIDACLADIEASFEASHGWDRAVPRIALLGGVLAASVCLIRGGMIQALVSAGVGAVAAAMGAGLTRRARTLEQMQRQRADELVSLFAGGAAGKRACAGTRSTGHSLGLDRRGGRR